MNVIFVSMNPRKEKSGEQPTESLTHHYVCKDTYAGKHTRREHREEIQIFCLKKSKVTAKDIHLQILRTASIICQLNHEGHYDFCRSVVAVGTVDWEMQCNPFTFSFMYILLVRRRKGNWCRRSTLCRCDP